jgi:glutathione S-transferase
MITVYGVARSRAMRVLWMLEELGVPYEHVPTPFMNGGARTPEFLRINPNGHVPALVDGSTTLFESLAINLYLARKYDHGLWPSSIEDEGRTFQWSIWAMTELEEPVVTALIHRALRPEAERDAAKGADAALRAAKPLAVLDRALADRPYLLGDTFTVADLNVASVLALAPLARIDLDPFVAVRGWHGRCCARPALDRVRERQRN